MSRRRRRAEEPPLSLFSFQDIITCVTGILILVTLLMTLDISDRAEEAVRQSGEVSTRQLQEMRAGVSALKAELEELDRLAPRSAIEPLEVSESRVRQVEASVREWQRVRDTLAVDVSVAEAESRRQQAQAEVNAMNAVEATQAREREVRERARKARESAANEQRRAEEVLKGIVDSPLFVVRGERGGRSPVVVDVGLLRVSATRIKEDGTTERGVVFEGISAEAEFRVWASRRDRASEYFVLMVRPGGVATYQSLVEWIRDEGFSVGTELVPDDLGVLPPSPDRPGGAR